MATLLVEWWTPATLGPLPAPAIRRVCAAVSRTCTTRWPDVRRLDVMVDTCELDVSQPAGRSHGRSRGGPGPGPVRRAPRRRPGAAPAVGPAGERRGRAALPPRVRRAGAVRGSDPDPVGRRARAVRRRLPPAHRAPRA